MALMMADLVGVSLTVMTINKQKEAKAEYESECLRRAQEDEAKRAAEAAAVASPRDGATLVIDEPEIDNTIHISEPEEDEETRRAREAAKAEEERQARLLKEREAAERESKKSSGYQLTPAEILMWSLEQSK